MVEIEVGDIVVSTTELHFPIALNHTMNAKGLSSAAHQISHIKVLAIKPFKSFKVLDIIMDSIRIKVDGHSILVPKNRFILHPNSKKIKKLKKSTKEWLG